jgi:hypothetical protein
MGIYSNGTIYGIKIYTFAENASENWSSQNVGSPHIFSSNANENDDFSNTLYEQVYDVIMTDEQKLEAYDFYFQLGNQSNQNRFQVYTECMSTLEPNDKTTFKSWLPISLEQFLEIFNV